ncbi:MAG TPA: hypothetical protein VD766_09450, partial [Solirubrobacterales bacterium]|nr:hypothetical protein [Solirubrobacterales bacterium]
MTLNPTGSDPTPPSIGNTLVGAAGFGLRATAAAFQITGGAARAAARPGTAVIRAGLQTPPGERARAEARSLMANLDAAGRRDIERARVEV